MNSAETAPRSHIDDWADRIVCWFLRHGLALLLFGLMMWATLPLLAPVAFHVGLAPLGKAIHILYRPLCHQLPQRSWFLFGPQLTYTLAEIAEVTGTVDAGQLRRFYGSPELGWKMAWSDRMVSFYAMTPVFGVVYLLLQRLGTKIRPISAKVLLLSLLPMFIDGSTHMLSDIIYGISADGFRDTNAWLAVLTGSRFPGFYGGDHLYTFNWWMRLLTGLLAAWGTAFYVFPHLDRLFRGEARRSCSGRARAGAMEGAADGFPGS